MEFLTLLKMLVGFFALIIVRAFIRTGKKRFDFFNWLKYDFQRLMLGMALLVVVWLVLILEPTALTALSSFGLQLSQNSAVLLGFGIGGFALIVPSNNPGK